MASWIQTRKPGQTRMPILREDPAGKSVPEGGRSQGLTEERENVVGGPWLGRAGRLGVARCPDGLRAGLQQDHPRLSGNVRARSARAGTARAGTARTGGTRAG